MRNRIDLVTAAAVGVAAGLAGAYAMELWQTGATALKETAAKKAGEEPDDATPATEKAADAVSQAVRGKPVAEEARPEAGRRVHYVTGAVLGAIYGLACELWPPASAGFGGGLALSSALVMDDALVPLLGFGPPPQETAPVDHAYSLGAHAVFGIVTEAARRLLRGGAA